MKLQSAVLPLLIVGGLLVNHRLAQTIQPYMKAPVGMTKTQQTRLEEVASASLFGQFRSNMADFLWMKADKYLHRGIDLRAMTEAERAARHNAQHAKGEAHSHGHSETHSHGHGEHSHAEEQPHGGISHGAAGEENANREHIEETTVVLAPQYDWRGILGNIEREVKPYMNMEQHNHTDPKETLPLFRLMTWTNPNFVQGYAVGAVMIAREEQAFDEAIRFIQEGENNNPESIEIQETFAYLLMHASYFKGRNDYPEAVRHAERGNEIAKKRDPQTLSTDEWEAWQECVRRRVIAYREMKQLKQALQSAKEGLASFPDDVTCRNFIANHDHQQAEFR